MKRSLLSLAVTLSVLAVASVTHAQTIYTQSSVALPCDKAIYSPIQCGYYDEGYQDGQSDAQNNRDNDYRRYRNKIGSDRYEDHYRRGYDAGYNAVRPFARWTSVERSAYDQGFRDGENDRRRGISRLPERYEGDYARATEIFYKDGYFDGYDNRSRQYDKPIGPYINSGTVNPTYPNSTPDPWGNTGGGFRRGTPTGTINWSGRVDNMVNIVIKGDSVTNQRVAGTLSGETQNMTGILPRRPVTLSVRKDDGRGSAVVIQQPSRGNNYTGIVQVSDPKSGADNYRLEISWSSPNAEVEEQYQAGRVAWSGRVDQTANIIISGSEVRSEDASNTGLRNVNFNISGYLARRPGTVNVTKLRGRGTVTVLQQPSYENDFVAVIRVVDTDKSDDEYRFEVTW